MNSDTFQSFLRRVPFQPLEVRMSNGDAHQIRHPETALVLKSNVVLGNPDSDDFQFLSLLHVAEVKAVSTVGRKAANGEQQQ